PFHIQRTVLIEMKVRRAIRAIRREIIKTNRLGGQERLGATATLTRLSGCRYPHCALARAALTFRIARRYEVRAGEPLSVTTRMMWATPIGHGLFASAQFGPRAAVAVTMARAVSPCENVISAL